MKCRRLLGVALCTVLVMGTSCQLLNKEEVPKKFGATYMNMDNPYFVAMDNSIEMALAANGDILLTRDPVKDQEKQNEQILELIEAGVEVIFINPVDWKAIKPALEACYEAGVALFNLDTYVYDRAYITASIMSDNYQAGVLIAEDIMAKKDRASIVIINDTNVNSTDLRVAGFLDTLEGREAYEVVYYSRETSSLEGAMEITKKMLTRNIDFDVILGGNDPTALGALAALQQAGMELEDVLIYGIDGSPDGKTDRKSVV